MHSFDLNPVTQVQAPGVSFHRGDAHNLGHDLPPDFMHGLPRPLLVIEDSTHQKQTSLAVLNFFHQWLRHGEYIVIEDGIVTELGMAAAFNGGPQAAIEEFLGAHPEYEVDTRYCDKFGKNVTYAVNGFLRRLR